MSFFSSFLDFLFHLDVHLGEIIIRYGTLTHFFLFLVIFAETGFVFTPFLPGDSLLFAAGAFAALGSLKLGWLLFLLWGAAFFGDTVNYWIGYFFGKKIIENPRIPLINQKHVKEAQEFYEKHGGKTIFLARFIPIIRTFAPFVAGVGRMKYSKFIFYNILGGLAWSYGFILMGYFFGNIPLVKDHFSLLILAIVLISVLPLIIDYLKKKLSLKRIVE